MTQPTSTPPGGGSWTWDEKKNDWLPKVPVPDPQAAGPTPEKPATAKPAKPTPAQE